MIETIQNRLQAAIQNEMQRLEGAQSTMGRKHDLEIVAFKPVAAAALELALALKEHSKLITLDISERSLEVKLGHYGDRRYGTIDISTNGKSYLVLSKTFYWTDESADKKITLQTADETIEYLVTECGKFIAHKEKYGRQ